jgi:hypothetical protein
VVVMRPELDYMSLVSYLVFIFCAWFLLPHPSLTFLSLSRGSRASGSPNPRSQRMRRLGRCIGWRPKSRSGRKIKRRGRPARRWWPATCWRRTAERRRGRGSHSSPLPGVRRRRMTMMRGWRSAPALAPRPGSVPCQPPRALLAAQPFLCRGNIVPVRGAGIRRACSRPYRGRRGRCRGRGSHAPSHGSRRCPCRCAIGVPSAATRWMEYRGGAYHSPSCCRPRVRIGPCYLLALGPRAESCRRGNQCLTIVIGEAAGAKDSEDQASVFACFRVRIHSARKPIRVFNLHFYNKH